MASALVTEAAMAFIHDASVPLIAAPGSLADKSVLHRNLPSLSCDRVHMAMSVQKYHLLSLQLLTMTGVLSVAAVARSIFYDDGIPIRGVAPVLVTERPLTWPPRRLADRHNREVRLCEVVLTTNRDRHWILTIAQPKHSQTAQRRHMRRT